MSLSRLARWNLSIAECRLASKQVFHKPTHFQSNHIDNKSSEQMQAIPEAGVSFETVCLEILKNGSEYLFNFNFGNGFSGFIRLPNYQGAT